MIRSASIIAMTVATLFSLLAALPSAQADLASCGPRICPDVETSPGGLTASYLERSAGGGWVASNSAPAEHPWTYQLSHPCVVDDRESGACRGSDFQECDSPPGRVVEDLIPEQRRLVLAGEGDTTRTIDGYDPRGAPVGAPVGPWIGGERACIDITALNPAPSPGEVFRYFQTLPLPQLPTRQQPPGNGLVGLPVIFFTDGPTTQTFTLDIRGFTVDITATASSFTWRTGDGTELTTTDPGAPYPDHTVSHDYASGTWTAALTTTWTGTFSVDGGLTVPVPGSTTTDGPPVTFDVLQARPVLTNPFD
jgi:hypothetical protein